MRICFLDKTEFKYDYNDKYSSLLRGAETAFINLSKSISQFFILFSINCSPHPS